MHHSLPEIQQIYFVSLNQQRTNCQWWWSTEAMEKATMWHQAKIVKMQLANVTEATINIICNIGKTKISHMQAYKLIHWIYTHLLIMSCISIQLHY